MDVLIFLFLAGIVAVLVSLPLAVGAFVGSLFKRDTSGPSLSSERPMTQREIWLEMVRERKRQRLEMIAELEEELRRDGITSFRSRNRSRQQH